MDEAAQSVGKDPLAFRLELLTGGVRTVGPYRIDQGRLARALRSVATAPSNSTPVSPPPIAVCRSNGFVLYQEDFTEDQLVQLREKDWSAARIAAFAARCSSRNLSGPYISIR